MTDRPPPDGGHVRRAFGGLFIGWLVFLLEPLSATGLTFGWFAILFVLTAVFGLLSLGLVLTARPLSRGWLLAWLLYPAAAVVLVLLVTGSQTSANPLFRLRFQLSRTALDDTARRALARTPPAPPSRIGLFPIERVDVCRGRVRGPVPGGRRARATSEDQTPASRRPVVSPLRVVLRRRAQDGRAYSMTSSA